MLNDFIGGGQVFLHKLRMLFQVLSRSFSTALLVSIVIIAMVSYAPAKQLDIKAALTYQKALFAIGFDESMASIRKVINPRVKYYIHKIDAHSSKGLTARNVDPRSVIKSPLFRTAHIKAMAFLQARLVSLFLVMGGIFLLIFVVWSKFGKNLKSETAKDGSGKILTSREVAMLLRRIGKASKITINNMPIVKNSETSHFLITGATGSGKTNLIHNILPQAEKSGQPAIIIDQTGEMIAKYYNPERGDIIFNPFDKRTKSWDFWGDCDNPQELERFSKILFGFNRKKAGSTGDPFWEQSAETVFNACAEYQRGQCNYSIEQLSSMVRTSSLNDLARKLTGSSAHRYFAGENKTTISSILSVLTTSTKPLTYLTDHNVAGSFSIKEYFASLQQGSKSWLFLATKPSSRELTLPLIACLTELAFCRLMDIGIDRNRRIWLVIDELASLGKLPALATLMAEGRKYGACVLAGLQSLNQIYDHYGHYAGSTIFGQFGTNFFFRNNEPAIAKMVSDMCGSETINRQQKNISFGANEFRDGISYHEQQQRKNLVEYSDLAKLATGQCYILMPEPQVRIARIKVPEVKLPDKNIGFIENTNFSPPKNTLPNNDSIEEIVEETDGLLKVQTSLTEDLDDQHFFM